MKIHTKFLTILCVCAALYLMTSSVQTGSAQARRPIVPSDCVTVRRILADDGRPSIRFNPQGTAAAYLVQIPNLVSNQNDIRLDLAPMRPGEKVQHLFVGTDVSGLQWTDNGHSIAILAKHDGRVSIVKVDLPSGRVHVVAKATTDIAEFSISNDGRTIAYAVNEPSSTKLALPGAEDEARGYRIPFERTQTSLRSRRRIFLLQKSGTAWTKATPVRLRLPSLHQSLDVFPYVLNLRLSLSPDGASLLFTYVADKSEIPEEWQRSATVREILTTAGGVELMPVFDVKTGIASLPFRSPWALSQPYWSPDSSAFVLTANSPANSNWDKEDIQHHRAVLDSVHQFEIRPKEGTVHLVRTNLHGFYGRPVFWGSDGQLVLRSGDGELTYMTLHGDQWNEGVTRRIPSEPGQYKLGEVASNGSIIVSDFETPSVPPSLQVVAVQPASQRIIPLNPQFDALTLAPYREIHWKTSTGFRATGYLFLPPDFDSHKAYPLVIHAYPAASNFFCDSGFNHMPSFAPQPIANAGMMYLIRIYTDGAQQTEEQKHWPKGYPGQLGEAAFETDIWDSAVDQLSAEGLIDPRKVGIIGFSRSGWYTEFALTHGRTKYAAATVADNVQYSLGEYWVVHSSGTMQGDDAMYGGPPYGDTLKNWLDHSISFNLQKIHAAVLMEVMGYGAHYTNADTAPSNIVLKSEVFTGLKRLGNPVEMYYYPLEQHQPDHPIARLMSLQRNLDWYAFWLQDREPKDVTLEERQRYLQWRALQRDRQTSKATTRSGLRSAITELTWTCAAERHRHTVRRNN